MSITVKLIKEEKKQLTFGDVPNNSGFVDESGNFCIKINEGRYPTNAIFFLKEYIFFGDYFNSDPITRLCDIEITEVRK